MKNLTTHCLSSQEELDDMVENQSFPFPNITDIEGEEEKINSVLEHVKTLFVDKSGFGLPNEPALTLDQFVETLSDLIKEHKKELHLAITGEGLFQIYVDVWK